MHRKIGMCASSKHNIFRTHKHLQDKISARYIRRRIRKLYPTFLYGTTLTITDKNGLNRYFRRSK